MESKLNSIREELILKAVHTFVTSIKKIDIPVDELLHIVKETYVVERSKDQGD